jgi:hypothetical protein
MKLHLLFYLAIATILLTSCTTSKTSPQPETEREETEQFQKVISLDKNFQIVIGQTVYVPAYSHIYHQDKKQTFDLAITLSIRNTDPTNSIVVKSVRYYNSEGKLLKKYLEQPIQLTALASTDFFVDTSDTSGGSGASFIVEWVAQTKVTEPAIEAVMIGSGFQQGISFVSPGRVIKRQGDRLQ